eukprot:Amastigsp_a345032_16.p2 type:complete len:308 gc:universal Amastigsp_a345032_16:1879-956(-)
MGDSAGTARTKMPPSSHTATISCWSGEIASLRMLPVRRTLWARVSPSSYDHSCTTRSSPPVTNRSPSAKTATELAWAGPGSSISRIAEPSKTSQNPILRSVPHVSACASCGWNTAWRNNVGANMTWSRIMRVRSQTMHEPSDDAVRASRSFDRIWIETIGPRCSLSAASICCDSRSSRQTRTCPSEPPETMRLPSDDAAMAVTASVCAELITNSCVPVSGPNARMRPSAQPERIAPPSCEKAMQRHSTLGTTMRTSSSERRAFQTRMSPSPHVAKTSENPCGNAMSRIAPGCPVDRSSASSDSRSTR